MKLINLRVKVLVDFSFEKRFICNDINLVIRNYFRGF